MTKPAIDWELDSQIVDALESVFDWMLTKYDRETGSAALKAHYGHDWADAWQNWWDEGE